MLDLARIRIRSSENGIEDGGQIHGVDGRREGRGDDRAGAWKTGFLLFRERSIITPQAQHRQQSHLEKSLGSASIDSPFSHPVYLEINPPNTGNPQNTPQRSLLPKRSNR